MYVVDLKETSIYQEFLAMKEEIMMHKWYESEKAGYDIGFPRAVIDWTVKFKSKWVTSRKKKKYL
jgi:hypothetical protein